MREALAGLDTSVDAAVIAGPPAGHVLVQSIDFFRSIVSDPYIFGAISANHALSVRPAFFNGPKKEALAAACHNGSPRSLTKSVNFWDLKSNLVSLQKQNVINACWLVYLVHLFLLQCWHIAHQDPFS